MWNYLTYLIFTVSEISVRVMLELETGYNGVYILDHEARLKDFI